MELTTRCPECETVFPVSLEQLQLRKGYIRCIQCAHIFDGFEAAVPGEPSRPAEQGGARQSVVEPTMPPMSEDIGSGNASWAVDQPDSTPGKFIIPSSERFQIDSPEPAQPFSISDTAAGRASATPPEEPSFSSVPTLGAALDDDEPRVPSVLRQRGGRRAPATAAPDFTISAPAARPEKQREDHLLKAPAVRSGSQPEDAADTDDYLFVEPREERRSERYQPEFMADARRQRAWMTPVWALLTLCGLILLVLQGVYVYRAQLAGAFPGLRPSLEMACERLGCGVPYERRIEAIAITGSALRASGSSDDDISSLVLEVTIRNTHEQPQEWPTLVLDLKDASGTVVVRRNLAPDIWVPAELRQGPFVAGSEIKVQLPVAVRGLQANGYQLDKFFP
ncbi:MAG: DUF3426 domain-containing protein [Alcaligenaceae bacterium]|nr:DUF3426 domain-containing protein [Alcaligenaceae bacterium]